MNKHIVRLQQYIPIAVLLGGDWEAIQKYYRTSPEECTLIAQWRTRVRRRLEDRIRKDPAVFRDCVLAAGISTNF